jgi:hypothetical protein
MKALFNTPYHVGIRNALVSWINNLSSNSLPLSLTERSNHPPQLSRSSRATRDWLVLKRAYLYLLPGRRVLQRWLNTSLPKNEYHRSTQNIVLENMNWKEHFMDCSLILNYFLNELEYHKIDDVCSDIMEHLWDPISYSEKVFYIYGSRFSVVMFPVTKQGLLTKKYEELTYIYKCGFKRHIHKHSSD